MSLSIIAILTGFSASIAADPPAPQGISGGGPASSYSESSLAGNTNTFCIQLGTPVGAEEIYTKYRDRVSFNQVSNLGAEKFGREIAYLLSYGKRSLKENIQYQTVELRNNTLWRRLGSDLMNRSDMNLLHANFSAPKTVEWKDPTDDGAYTNGMTGAMATARDLSAIEDRFITKFKNYDESRRKAFVNGQDKHVVVNGDNAKTELIGENCVVGPFRLSYHPTTIEEKGQVNNYSSAHDWFLPEDLWYEQWIPCDFGSGCYTIEANGKKVHGARINGEWKGSVVLNQNGTTSHTFKDELEYLDSISLLDKNGSVVEGNWTVLGEDKKTVLCTNGNAHKNKIPANTNFNIQLPMELVEKIGESVSVRADVYCRTAGGSYALLQNSAKQKLIYAYEANRYYELAQGQSKPVKLIMDIGGTVWQDDRKGKDREVNGRIDSGEKGISGVTVKLYSKEGLVKQTQTNSLGAYKFKSVLIRDDYEVVFSYNGQTYLPTKTMVNGENDINNSKATETQQDRKSFNAKFYEIAKNQARNQNGTKTMDLSYTKKGYESFVNPNAQFYINSSTKAAGYQISIAKGKLQLDHINLGLMLRDKASLSLTKDLIDVETTINGKSHRYEYDQLKHKNGFDITVKYSDAEYANMKYTNLVYRSDYNYRMDQYVAQDQVDGIAGRYDETLDRKGRQSKEIENSELRIFATYRITIHNSSEVALGLLQELINYQDQDFTMVDSYAMFDGKRYIVEWKNNEKYGAKASADGYLVTYTQSLNKIKMRSGEDIEVYLKYEVNKDENGRVKLSTTKNNVAEIGAYSTFNRDDPSKIEGLIDCNSAPNNVKPGDKKTYEDDNAIAPPLTIKFTSTERKMSGFVWEDTSSITQTSGGAKVGDGQRDSKEPLINGITVQLIEINKGKKYIWKQMTTGEKEQGKYLFTGYIPGTFMVRYRYGDTEKTVYVSEQGGKNAKSYNGQDYKATVFNKEGAANKSDARDNYARRKTVNRTFETLTNEKSALLALTNTINQKKTLTADQKAKIKDQLIPDTYMFADTDSIKIEVETPTAETENIDFGLVLRPKAQLVLTKEIANLKLTLEDGTVLIDTDPSKIASYIKWIAPAFNAKETKKNRYERTKPLISGGTGAIELDEELMQGTMLQITYRFTVTNTGEVDYADQNFYETGVATSESQKRIATTTASTIVDYVQNNLSFDKQTNSDWNVTTKTKLNSDGLVQKGINLNGYNTIIKTDKLAGYALKPKAAIGHGVSETETKASMDLVLTKVISADEADDELCYENGAELVKVTNQMGRKQESSILGNQDPSQKPSEIDSDASQAVTITPPTGQKPIYYAFEMCLSFREILLPFYAS